MSNYRKLYFTLLAGTILSTPANFATAATLTPTLDTIKAEAADISGSYELTGPIILPTLEKYSEGRVIATIKLIADNRDYLNRVPDEYREIFASIIPENVVLVEIDNKMYYFTPSDNDAERFRTLAGTVAGNLKEDENGIFEFDGKKYSFDVAAIPASVFEYVEGTAEDYNFTMQEADAEGNITTKYYKIVLKPETFATSENIKWSTTEPTAGDITGSVAVNLPNNQTQTFYYSYEHPGFLENSSKITWETTAAVETPGMTDSDLSDDNQVKGVVKIDLPNNKSEYYEYTYTKPEGYTDATDRIDDTLSSANVTSVVFKGISSSSDGGAIYNTQNHGDIDIIADFIGNDANGRASGGAIYNRGTIGDITGDFIGNYIDFYNGNGGAIYNSANAVIGNITGNFIGNYIRWSGNGGAIYNSANAVIGDITGNFIGNSIHSDHGGAIYNSGIIGNIIGNFVDNSIDFNYNGVYGGAIYNTGIIDNITGDFIGNHAEKINTTSYGGAIYNYGTIGDITGDFIGNYADSGGAINNSGTIGDITGDFIGNNGKAIYNANNNTIGDITGNFIGNNGRAIYNESTIRDITGDFIGNNGGAIYNHGTIGDITGDFIGNYTSGYGSQGGEAIYNRGTIGDITGDFIGNYVQGESEVFGGAIYNSGTIGDITGDFIGNYAQGKSEKVRGGAIYNSGTIGDITGDFIGNYVQGKSEEVRGGAIYNSGTIGDITGDFIGNHISGSGGVIYNVGSIGNIAGNFIGNYMKTESGVVAGGIIVNGGGNLIGDSIGSEYSSYYHRPRPNTAGTITGEFFGNYIESTGGSAVGGVIYNATDSDYLSVVNQVTGNFTGNHISVVDGYAYGGAVYNDAQSSFDTSELSDITLLHLNVKYNDQEMEIYLPMGEPTDGNIKMASGTLTVSSEEEFLTYKQFSIYAHLLEVDPANFGAEDYVDDLMIQLGAVQEEQREEFLAEFEAQSPEEQEKALTEFRQMAETIQNMVNNATLVTDITTTFTGGMTFYNSSFRNNYVKSENGEAKGGAIYGNGVTITADNYTSIIDGNKANDESNAFYVSVLGGFSFDVNSSVGDLTLNTLNNGVILLNDGIDGESGYSVAMTLSAKGLTAAVK